MGERLTRKELSARWRVSTRTVDRMVKDDAIPFLRVRRQVFFPLAEIEAWEQRQLAEPATPAAW